MGLVRDMVQSGLYGATASAVGGATVTTGLSGAGTTQATATAVPQTAINVFGTVALNQGAVLPVGALGDVYLICNQGANPLLVYPPVGGTINALSANASYSLTNALNGLFQCASKDGLTWYALKG